MDVIAMHQAGFTQAVASLGTAFTSGQASLLRRYANEILLSYDSDGAGVNAALRAIGILKEAGMTGRVINLEPYKDPDEFIKALGGEEFQKRLDHAENSFFFELRQLQKNYDLSDPEQKTAFHREIARKLCTFRKRWSGKITSKRWRRSTTSALKTSAGWWEPMPPRPGLHSL